MGVEGNARSLRGCWGQGQGQRGPGLGLGREEWGTPSGTKKRLLTRYCKCTSYSLVAPHHHQPTPLLSHNNTMLGSSSGQPLASAAARVAGGAVPQAAWAALELLASLGSTHAPWGCSTSADLPPSPSPSAAAAAQPATGSCASSSGLPPPLHAAIGSGCSAAPRLRMPGASCGQHAALVTVSLRPALPHSSCGHLLPRLLPTQRPCCNYGTAAAAQHSGAQHSAAASSHSHSPQHRRRGLPPGLEDEIRAAVGGRVSTAQAVLTQHGTDES